MQNQIDAFRLMVHGYPGGLPALCARMGWPYETARKEIAKAHGFKLGAERMFQAMELCEEAGGENCHALRDAIDSTRHGTSRADAAASMDTRLARAMKELADVARAHAEAMVDGSYSDNDLRRMNKEVLEAIAAVVALGEGAQAEHARSLRAV